MFQPWEPLDSNYVTYQKKKKKWKNGKKKIHNQLKLTTSWKSRIHGASKGKQGPVSIAELFQDQSRGTEVSYRTMSIKKQSNEKYDILMWLLH